MPLVLPPRCDPMILVEHLSTHLTRLDSSCNENGTRCRLIIVVRWRGVSTNKHAVTASDSGSFAFTQWGQEFMVYMYTLCHLCVVRMLTEMAYGCRSLVCACACMHMACMNVYTTVFGRFSPFLQEESCMMDALREQALGTVLLASICIRICRASKCRGAKIR